MSPDDPRHGTVRGYRAPCRCAPCRAANSRYSKQRRLRILEGRQLTVSPVGTRRRIEALQRMGWSLQDIADEVGWRSEQAVHRLLQRKRLKPETVRKVSDAYERLCMTVGPSPAAARRAEVAGYAPPLAWDDIDRDVEPCGMEGDDDTDPAVVARLIAGERIDSTPAEKVEAMRQWLAAGKSQRSLCRMHGWREGRYVEKREDAA